MTVENATEAAELTKAALTLDQVLESIEWAAKKGVRSWTFAWLSMDVCAELGRRGFITEASNTGFVRVTW